MLITAYKNSNIYSVHHRKTQTRADCNKMGDANIDQNINQSLTLILSSSNRSSPVPTQLYTVASIGH